MKGFTKFIVKNHPDPDGLIDLDSDGGHGRLHTQMCRLAEEYANQRVIEELESILDKTQLATKVDSIRSHIAYRNTEYKLKQD